MLVDQQGSKQKLADQFVYDPAEWEQRGAESILAQMVADNLCEFVLLVTKVQPRDEVWLREGAVIVRDYMGSDKSEPPY